MKTENKHSVMIWTIVVLAVMNVSTIATVVYYQRQSVREELTTTSDPNQQEANADQFSGRYFRENLDFNEEQMEKFRKINPLFRPKVRDITVELNLKRKQMLQEMSAVKSDTSLLNAISDSIGYLHSDLKKLTYMYYLEMKGICDPEQQKKLEQLFGEVFSNDASIVAPGRGAQRGRQFGRQFDN
jgi:Spy/CpxP family protein refolding chaperone